MKRFYGNIGFEMPGENVNGVYVKPIVERPHKGDVLEETRSYEPDDKVEDDFRLQHRIRIIGDAYALEHYAKIKYVMWQGTCWTVNSISLARPRLTLALGGVYHGKRPTP